jgi:hypothetical protein
MLSPELEAVGPKNASRIWGFLSKFVILDRFLKTLGLGKLYPGLSVPREKRSLEHLGTASKVEVFFWKPTLLLTGVQILEELNPPTKVVAKFLRTWRDREKHRAEYSRTAPTPSTADGRNPPDVALALSRRLIAVVKVKNILHIEAGLEMIALAMAISSEVSHISSFKKSYKSFLLE